MTIDTIREQDRLTVKVSGSLDTATAPRLEEELGGDALNGVKELLMDFTSLKYIYSAGLRVLLSCHKTMKAQGGTMVIRGANEGVMEIFEITGFSEILSVEP